MPPVTTFITFRHKANRKAATDSLARSVPCRTPTLNRFALSLPTEIYCRIAMYLAVSDLKALVRTCKNLHDIGSRSLYHTVEATHRDGARIFAALLLRYQRLSAHHIRDAPLLSIRCISYVSTSADDDLRVFPLLGDVLTRAFNLRHLHIDIHDRSASALLAVLKRRGVARAIAPSPIAAAFDFNSNRTKRISCTYSLPRLRGLQMSNCKVLSELGRLRTLTSVILDEVVTRDEMVTMLNALSYGDRGTHIVSFSCIWAASYGEGFLWAIAAAFPKLTFLSMSVPDETLPHFYDETYHAVSSILGFLIKTPYVLADLQVIALDFYWTVSAAWDAFVEHVQWDRLTSLLSTLTRARPILRKFFLARAELRYDDKEGKWRVNAADAEERELERRRLATAGVCQRMFYS
ncbi:hypothetical protein K466DRAFT_601541 [Polyporus arcularius HHB13444]|uniref:F-box domain-containing protein n=1 Tax=Polyporus arcularius HHB13444 TaxID=1314778 RepID=A0A5C3P9W3_9APHY|nr:hypothetical protein K466DRAFT_601541 [Polyporus arcularius HHB13444]